MIMAIVGIAAFLGLVFARTSLDNSAFELVELDTAIEQLRGINAVVVEPGIVRPGDAIRKLA
jgi:hypothetical protein